MPDPIGAHLVHDPDRITLHEPPTDPNPPIPSLRGVRPPTQRRSQATLDRLIGATVRLLDGRDFNEISVMEICTTAEISPSSFYARFESKERLLATLHKHHLAGRRSLVDETVERLRRSSLELHDLVHAAASVYLAEQLNVGPFLQTLRRAELSDPALADARRSLDRYAVDAVVDAIADRVGPGDPEVRRRVEFATRSMCAALLDAVQPPFSFQRDLQLDVEALLRESVQMWMGYVAAPPTSALQDGIVRSSAPPYVPTEPSADAPVESPEPQEPEP